MEIVVTVDSSPAEADGDLRITRQGPCKVSLSIFRLIVIHSGNYLPKSQNILSIKSSNDNIEFTMKDSIIGSVLKENPELKSDKTDDKSHGYGVNLIREVSKNTTDLQISSKRKVYSAAMLCYTLIKFDCLSKE